MLLVLQSKALAAATEALRVKAQEAARRAQMAAEVAKQKKSQWDAARGAAQREYPLTEELQQAFQDLPSNRCVCGRGRRGDQGIRGEECVSGLRCVMLSCTSMWEIMDLCTILSEVDTRNAVGHKMGSCVLGIVYC